MIKRYRVGNFVVHSHRGQNNIWEIININLLDDDITIRFKLMHKRVPVSNIKPITITDKLLTLFSFRQRTVEMRPMEMRYFIKTNPLVEVYRNTKIQQWVFVVGDVEINIDHLHHLQNLILELTDYELKIT